MNDLTQAFATDVDAARSAWNVIKEAGQLFTEVKTSVLFLIKCIPEFLLPRAAPTPLPAPRTNADWSNTAVKLRDAKERLDGGDFEPCQPVKLSGAFFPAELMSKGWWERPSRQVPEVELQGANPLGNVRDWLYHGFKEWAPSWDLATSNPPRRRFMIAQLGYSLGDEADSVPVVIGPEKAQKIREALANDELLVRSVDVRGRIYRPEDLASLDKGNVLERLKSLRSRTDVMPGYIILVRDDESEAEIEIEGSPDIYSGYLWQCWARKGDLVDAEAGRLTLDRTIFLWEHTNFANENAIKFNYHALEKKRQYIERQLGAGELVLLQHAIDVGPIVGVPQQPKLRASGFRELIDLTRAEILRD